MADPHKSPRAAGYVSNPRYDREDWDTVSDNPKLTEGQLSQALPFVQVFPNLARRGPQKSPTKIATSIRLDPDVVAALKAAGPRWQTRVNQLLRKALVLPRASSRTARGATRAKSSPPRRRAS